MARNFKSSSDVGGESTIVTAPGTYHCLVIKSADGASTKGNQMDGVSALLEVVAGTTKGQEERKFHLSLFDPDLSKSDAAQEWSVKKQTAFAIAINQLDPSKLGEEVSIEFGAGEGQQLFITLAENTYDGKTNLELSFANIYHVDDPRASGFPKNEAALKLLPAECRKKVDYFAALKKEVKKPAAAAVSVDDL